MTNRIIIGTEDHDLHDIDESWIAQQIVRRKQAGVPVCVVVKLDSNGLNLTLASGDCSSSGGGGRWTPSPQQQYVIDLWNKHNLSQSDINPGELIAFLKQVCK